MRLWTLHPKLLDRIGLVAQWREGLLAQKVLLGETKGYTNHPQLERFRVSKNPQGLIASFLRLTHKEATQRGYKFDHSKIINRRTKDTVPVTADQIAYEFQHLRKKVEIRNPDWLHRLDTYSSSIPPCPMFIIVPGPIERWERPHP